MTLNHSSLLAFNYITDERLYWKIRVNEMSMSWFLDSRCLSSLYNSRSKLKEYKYDYIIMKVKGKKREKIANTEERGVA